MQHCYINRWICFVRSLFPLLKVFLFPTLPVNCPSLLQEDKHIGYTFTLLLGGTRSHCILVRTFTYTHTHTYKNNILIISYTIQITSFSVSRRMKLKDAILLLLWKVTYFTSKKEHIQRIDSITQNTYSFREMRIMCYWFYSNVNHSRLVCLFWWICRCILK